MQAGSRIGRVSPPDDIIPDMRLEGLLEIGRVGDGNAAPAVIELTMAEGDGKFLNQGGVGTVEFVDGLSTECEVLFPLGDRLIVRSVGNRIAQSFDLRSVHAVEIDGKRTEYHPNRSLTAQEQQLRQVNALWADVPGEGQIGNYGKQDWPADPLMVWRRPGVPGSRFVVGNWLDQTGPDGTLELIGTNRVNDQFRIAGEGKLIISEGSYLAPGPRACFAIQPEATVVLLQDARISLETTATQLGKASVWVGGTLMIPMIQTEANHAEDAKVQQTWRDVLPEMRDPELEERRRQILEDCRVGTVRGTAAQSEGFLACRAVQHAGQGLGETPGRVGQDRTGQVRPPHAGREVDRTR